MKRIIAFAALFVSALLPAYASSVNLSWSEPSTTIPYGFNVYRIVAPAGATSCSSVTFSTSTWTQIVSGINAAQTTWSDSTTAAKNPLQLNTSYCYAVTAYGTTGTAETGPSNLFFITTASSTPPAATLPTPTSLTGTFVQ